MKISKEIEDNNLSVFQPNKKQKKLLIDISDKVIDLIDSYNLTDDEYIHLISSLYEGMKQQYDIIQMKHIRNKRLEGEE